MIVSAERLAQLAPHADPFVLAQIAATMQTALPQFGITNTLEVAHFAAQACWETQGFARFVENLNYTHASQIAAVWPRLAGRAADLVSKPQALANAAYAYRNGNGSEQSGDGWLFRGRGAFMVTGRDGYDRATKALGHPYLTNPDLVSQPADAVLTALNFWKANRCGIPALNDDAEGVTRIINGPARDGLSQRRDLTERAKHIFI